MLLGKRLGKVVSTTEERRRGPEITSGPPHTHTLRTGPARPDVLLLPLETGLVSEVGEDERNETTDCQLFPESAPWGWTWAFSKRTSEPEHVCTYIYCML